MTRNELTKLWAKVTGKFNALIGGAPEALDTLKEIADKLGDDDDALAGLLTQVGGKQNALVSGQNIKSINGQSVLGEGNMTIHEEQLIDKSYAPAEFSGLGRKYLQKNIVSGKNVLTQAMVSDANTIYVIQYDFTLDEDITVPVNCVLEFDGGSISGEYTITGNNTGIQAGLVKIFNTDVTLAGTWNVAESYPEWFGAKRDGVADDYLSLQCSINFGFISGTQVYLEKGVYLTSKPLFIYGVDNEVTTRQASCIIGPNKGGSLIKKSTTDVLDGPYTQNAVIILVNKRMIDGEVGIHAYGITLSNIAIVGNQNADYGIYAPISTAECTFSELQISNCEIAGIWSGNNNYLNLYNKIRISNCGDYGFKITDGVQTSDNFVNCYVTGCSTAYAVRGIYMQITNCCADGISDTVFNLTGFSGTVTSPGSEAINAKTMFLGGQYTDVTIINPTTFGNFTDEDAAHIVCNSGSHMKFIGGKVLYDNSGRHRTAPGWLYKTGGSQVILSFEETFFENFEKNSDAYPTNAVLISTKKQSLLFRNTNKIPYIGAETTDTNGYAFGVNAKANAIYMGFGEKPYILATGEEIQRSLPNIKGDIILSKVPAEIGAIGWVRTDNNANNSRWGNGEYLKIPILQSGGLSERPLPNNCDLGQSFFDTDINKHITFSKTENNFGTIKSSLKIKYFANNLIEGNYYRIKMTQGGSNETIKLIFTQSDSSIEGGIEIPFNEKIYESPYYSYFTDEFLAPNPVEYPYIATVQDNTTSVHFYSIIHVLNTWIEGDGATAGVLRSGNTVSRPVGSDIYVGFQYWDTDLGKMIAWNGTAWVDSSSIKNTSTIPATGLLPNVVYNYGTTDTVSVTLAAGDAGVANIWCFVFTAQTAACTVTLPSGVVLGNEYAWDMVAGRRYEVSIMDNVAIVNYSD